MTAPAHWLLNPYIAYKHLPHRRLHPVTGYSIRTHDTNTRLVDDCSQSLGTQSVHTIQTLTSLTTAPSHWVLNPYIRYKHSPHWWLHPVTGYSIRTYDTITHLIDDFTQSLGTQSVHMIQTLTSLTTAPSHWVLNPYIRYKHSPHWRLLLVTGYSSIDMIQQ